MTANPHNPITRRDVVCRAAECRRALHPGDWVSLDGYCQGCAEEVEAFPPTQGGEWIAVTAENPGDTQGADQCAGCGSEGYTRRVWQGRPVMVCDTCGARYFIRWAASHRVVF